MAKFFDNVTGAQKLILILGGFVLIIGAWVLFPGQTVALLTWIEDMVHHFVEFVQISLGGIQ